MFRLVPENRSGAAAALRVVGRQVGVKPPRLCSSEGGWCKITAKRFIFPFPKEKQNGQEPLWEEGGRRRHDSGRRTKTAARRGNSVGLICWASEIQFDFNSVGWTEFAASTHCLTVPLVQREILLYITATRMHAHTHTERGHCNVSKPGLISIICHFLVVFKGWKPR